jgi:hypothetical protein
MNVKNKMKISELDLMKNVVTHLFQCKERKPGHGLRNKSRLQVTGIMFLLYIKWGHSVIGCGAMLQARRSWV